MLPQTDDYGILRRATDGMNTLSDNDFSTGVLHFAGVEKSLEKMSEKEGQGLSGVNIYILSIGYKNKVIRNNK